MSLAIAKKQTPDTIRKKKHDTVDTSLKNVHTINSDHQTSIIQRKTICPCDGGCPRCAPVIQPKLTIGQPNDKYEQEADRVADEVMRMPESGVQRQCPEYEEGLQRQPVEEEEDMVQPKPIAEQITPLVQRQVEPEKEEEDEELIQAKIARDVPPEVTPATSSGIQSLQGGGRSLSESERSFFEPRFGADFSSVRVHDDTRAAGIAQLVNARAFTLGQDVVFGAGEYCPDGMTGKKLFAHELTHVVQQRVLGGQSSNTIFCNVLERIEALPGAAQRRFERWWQDLGSMGSRAHFWCNFMYTLLEEEVSAFEEAIGQRDSSAGVFEAMAANDIFSVITRSRLFLGQRIGIPNPDWEITDHDWEIVGATLDTAKCRVWHDRSRTANFSSIGSYVRPRPPTMQAQPPLWNMQNINQARINYIDAMIREVPTLRNGPTYFQKQLARLALSIFKERDHPQNLTYLLPGHPIAGQSIDHWIRARLNHTRVPPGPIEQVLGSWTPGFIVGSGL